MSRSFGQRGGSGGDGDDAAMLRSGAGGRRGWVLRVKAIVMRVLAVNARFLMWIVAPDLLARVRSRRTGFPRALADIPSR